jgi:hypothetical protein
MALNKVSIEDNQEENVVMPTAGSPVLGSALRVPSQSTVINRLKFGQARMRWVQKWSHALNGAGFIGRDVAGVQGQLLEGLKPWGIQTDTSSKKILAVDAELIHEIDSVVFVIDINREARTGTESFKAGTWMVDAV